jgi:signal transduction histidine kinase
MMFGGLAAVASLILRYRRAQGDERQQIRWVAAAAGAAGLALVVVVGTTIMAGGEDSSLSNAAFAVLLVTAGIGVPVATGIAVLKYRLYDLGLVVKKTLVFAVVATILTAIYGILLFFVPLLVLGVGSGTGFSSWQFLVTIVIAISFAPIRRRARSLADRIVYGGRATPYEVLSDFSERLGETYSTDDVLPRMAQLLGASTGAAEVMVLLKAGERLVPSTIWPVDHAVPVDAGALDEGLEVFPVTHQGEELGAITLRMSARDPMDPAKEQLVRDVASQAGLVLRNVRLISDLRESRRRIVAAQDERAQRLERNIHDGAQQQLVALAVRLRLAEQMADRDPARVKEMLGDLQADANDALENLRDLARGVYPPLLADKGLTAALEAQARKAAVPVTVLADGADRYPAEVEATVYFCTLEALQNVAKYAEADGVTVSLAPGDGVLTFTIADDGRGFDPRAARLGSGLQGMRDRVEALGGSLEIESAPGSGTSVTGRVPLHRESPTAGVAAERSPR